MVAVSRKFARLEELPKLIEEQLKIYERIRVEYPSEMGGFFLVKAWNKKE
jgi:hypothetical protein